MTLFDHYLEYMTQLMEGRRTPPEGITLPEGDMTEKVASLSRQLQQVGTAAFVRACARQDGVTLPEEIYRQADDTTSLQQLLQSAVQLAPVQEAPPAEEPSETAPDPDAGKHAFEVFLDCVALDDGLVQYLMEVLQNGTGRNFTSSARSPPSWIWTRRNFSIGWATRSSTPTRRSAPAPSSWMPVWSGCGRRDSWS